MRASKDNVAVDEANKHYEDAIQTAKNELDLSIGKLSRTCPFCGDVHVCTVSVDVKPDVKPEPVVAPDVKVVV